MVNRLYVSFWALCLNNLPQGRFEHRVIGAGEASQMIHTAHVDKTLLCVGAQAGRSPVDRDMQLPTRREDQAQR